MTGRQQLLQFYYDERPHAEPPAGDRARRGVYQDAGESGSASAAGGRR